ncbi:MAG: Gfo/Idh/MocA family oxidoreductase [Anaerolineae bacterium]|nr:Gfo/Idh/MocA family oxidoreductase [Anaerolineae bacterium]
MNKELNIAVIGCGYWGGNYVRLFTELPDTRVAIACDQKPENLVKIGERFPSTTLTTDMSVVMQMGGIDAVVIATNATTHFDIARQCLEAGKPVLLEKPMTTTVADAERLIEIAELHKVPLMIGHIYLYNPGVRKIKSLIENKELGQLYYLYTQRTNMGPIRTDVNAMWDLAPHDVSIMNYLMNASPEWVSAVGHNAIPTSSEDVGFIVLGYPNNVVGHIHVSWADPKKVRQLVAVGSEMRAVFNDLDPQEPVRMFEKGVSAPEPTSYGEHRFYIRNGDIISPTVPIREPLSEQGKHFIECIVNGTRPISDGYNGLEVVRVMEAVDRSIALKGAPIHLQTMEIGHGENGSSSEEEIERNIR